MTVYGNTEVVAALHQMVASGHVPHALLLHEDDGGGAFPLSINFLEELYGGSPRVQKLIHPDIHFVFPVAGSDKPVSMQFLGKFRELALENPYFFENELYTAIGIEGKQGNISVNEARSILDRLSLSAVEGGYRTVVVYLPEKMNAQAANALLKMVEEPPAKTLFVLITHAPEKVLVTISSRCLHMRVQPLSPEAEREVHARENASNQALTDLFHDLLEAIVSRDRLKALETGEEAALFPAKNACPGPCAGGRRRLLQAHGRGPETHFPAQGNGRPGPCPAPDRAECEPENPVHRFGESTI